MNNGLKSYEVAKISSDELENAVLEILEKAGDLAVKAVDGCIDSYVEETLLPELERRSPELTGDYKKGWRHRTIIKLFGKEQVAYQGEKEAPLTHLLESGFTHYKSQKFVPPQPHMRPAFDNTIEKLISALNSLADTAWF